MTEPTPEPIPMLPEWPQVRCDYCRRTYEIPYDKREGLITSTCPRCGGNKFSTRMRGTEGVLLVYVGPYSTSPRQEEPE